MDCNYGEVHCDSVKIADRSDSLRVHHKHVPWKIILVSYTRPLFRSTKANYFIGQLWQLLTASNVGALTQAWQAKGAVFKIPGFVTLGARDFSSAVSGFCQVFIVTRASPLVASAFGQHQKFPPHARKTSGTQGRGLSASVSFLSSPPPPRSFTFAIFRAVFDSRSSFFVPAPHGNACYAGYIFSSAPSNPHWTQRIYLPPLHCRLSKNVIITVKFLWSSGLFLQQENSAIDHSRKYHNIP